MPRDAKLSQLALLDDELVESMDSRDVEALLNHLKKANRPLFRLLVFGSEPGLCPPFIVASGSFILFTYSWIVHGVYLLREKHTKDD